MRTARAGAAVVLAALAAATLTACRSSSDVAGDDGPAVTLTKIRGTERFEVALAGNAVTRLGIATKPVAAAPHTAARPGVTTTVPYAAVVYDFDGSTWTYTALADGRTFVPTAIDVQSVERDTAYLVSGPKVGTQVVVVGAPELLGAEYQIAGEE
jgi:hypothetical protein